MNRQTKPRVTGIHTKRRHGWMTMNGTVSQLEGNGMALEWVESLVETLYFAWTRESHHIPEVQSRWGCFLQRVEGFHAHDVESGGR